MRNTMRFAALGALLLFLISPVPVQALGSEKPITLTVAAAASLRRAFEDSLIPLFRKNNPGINVAGTFDSSGKLQAQIENGLAADVFMSASAKQMNALRDGGFVDPGSIVDVLENKVVLIQPAAAEPGNASFENAAKAKVIAIGDPESVPAGQYAREIFTNLGIWDQVKARASFATNVSEALGWVAEGGADLGVVYATDAAATDRVRVVSEAPPGSLLTPVVYPAGRSKFSRYPGEAQAFLDFLSSTPALDIFAGYGFSPAPPAGSGVDSN